tara:strand:+ start:249 stop:965 length:717 start_codon:yes stop_codon:yes gene_type:complete
MTRIGINIDHVATIRNARGEDHPNVYQAAKFVSKCKVDSITIHLREDRRHINENDLKKICNDRKIKTNLEIAANFDMLKIALKHKPDFVCLVPEKRNEVTTEGGLNLLKFENKLKKIIRKLNKSKIRTSLFINPNLKDVRLSKRINAKSVELHTGKLSRLVKQKKNYLKELNKIKNCAKVAKKLKLEVHAGHGLDYKTTKILKRIKEIEEYNIGHFIIGESIFFGIKKIIKNFKKIIN